MFTSFTNRLHLLAGVLSFLTAAHTGHAQTTSPAPTPTLVAAEGTPATAITGTLRTPTGPVSGASIRLTGPGLVCVTNEDGGFFFSLPSGTGPQAAIITYAGGADVPVTLQPGTQLAPVEVPAVQLSGAQTRALKKAVKFGRKQGKKEARQLR